MKSGHGQTLPALIGVALAAAVALWWLGASRLALARGADTGRIAVDALNALLLTRAVALALCIGHGGGSTGSWAGGRGDALVLLAPAWPVAVLAWSASRVSAAQLLAAEAALLLAALVLPGLAGALRRAWPRDDQARLAGTTLGVALALGCWLSYRHWALLAG
jgi:hypothetical protein